MWTVANNNEYKIWFQKMSTCEVPLMSSVLLLTGANVLGV